jgi:DnaD/phage-associated family protein
MTELAQQEDIRELMFIAQQYLGKTLTSTEARTLCFFYDGLHFSPDLIDFLIEYCVSRGHKSFRYMEKVAMNWHEQGISTVHAARTQIESYHREYYDILKALGSDGRHPVEAEIKMMKKWLETWELPMPVILEACERTVLKTQKPTLRYADGILSRWQAEGVKSVDDVRRLDAEYIREKERAGKKAAPAVRKKTGSFSEFGQRSYDYDSLESKLLNQ